MIRLILVLIQFLALYSSTLCANETKQKTVSVTGECHLKTTADRGQLQLTIENLEKEVSRATSATNDQYNKLKKSLEKLSLSDLLIVTSNYNVYEQKDWENNKNVFKGYKASLGMRVESNDLNKFGEIIKAANNNNVTNIGQFSTFLSLEKQKSLNLECLKISSKNAKEKAQLLAQELNAKLGNVLTIQEEAPTSYYPEPSNYRSAPMMMAEKSSAAPEISADVAEYSKKIFVTFLLE